MARKANELSKPAASRGRQRTISSADEPRRWTGGRIRAHLTGLVATGLLIPTSEVERTAYLYQQGAVARGDRYARAAAMFDRTATDEGVASFTCKIVDGEPIAAMSLHGRYADLVVIAQSRRQLRSAGHRRLRHSRFRQIVLGGTTRTILESMTVPVPMSRC